MLVRHLRRQTILIASPAGHPLPRQVEQFPTRRIWVELGSLGVPRRWWTRKDAENRKFPDLRVMMVGLSLPDQARCPSTEAKAVELRRERSTAFGTLLMPKAFSEVPATKRAWSRRVVRKRHTGDSPPWGDQERIQTARPPLVQALSLLGNWRPSRA